MACRYSSSSSERELELASSQKAGSSIQSSALRQAPDTSSLPLTTLSFLNGTARGQWQKKSARGLGCCEPPRTVADPACGTQVSFEEASNKLISAWDGASNTSQIQAAGAFDSSVFTEAHHVFRNMSTPRSGGLRPVKLAVALNKPHMLQVGNVFCDVALELLPRDFVVGFHHVHDPAKINS